jgi:hypothetical protein
MPFVTCFLKHVLSMIDLSLYVWCLAPPPPPHRSCSFFIYLTLAGIYELGLGFRVNPWRSRFKPWYQHVGTFMNTYVGRIWFVYISYKIHIQTICWLYKNYVHWHLINIFTIIITLLFEIKFWFIKNEFIMQFTLIHHETWWIHNGFTKWMV